MNHGFLKQSTASQSRMVGPFIDDTDFKTTEIGLTIANTDVKLSKNGAAGVNKNSGGGTHRDNGMYSLTFDATDTDTVGELSGSIVVSGALPVVFKFTVLEEAIYDALIGASANGFDSSGRVDVGSWLGTAVTTSSTTSKPEVDVNSISDDATAANNCELMFDGTGYAGGTIKLDVNTTTIEGGDATDQINAACDSAIETYGLDHLVSAPVTGTDVIDDSIVAKLVSKEATADWDDFVNTTDSLQALRDQGDSAWITATGFSTHTAANVRTEMDGNSTQLAAIVADTNELQTDWVNGGRLDLILDELTTQGDTNEGKLDTIDGIVDAILLDTAEIGAAGAGLTEAGGTGDQLTAITGDLPGRITKNTALSNFEFFMADSADNVTGKTGLTVTAERSIDGAAFAACANSATEVANGIYKINLAAADLNGDVITFKFTAAGAVATFVTVVTQPT